MAFIHKQIRNKDCHGFNNFAVQYSKELPQRQLHFICFVKQKEKNLKQNKPFAV